MKIPKTVLRSLATLFVTILATATLTSGVSHSSTALQTPREFQYYVGWDDCHLGEVCLFLDVDGVGGGFAWPANTYTENFTFLNCTKFACPTDGTFNNQASSWYNRTGQKFCVSQRFNGGDPDATMPAGISGNFTSIGWNDTVSSIGYLGCPRNTPADRYVS